MLARMEMVAFLLWSVIVGASFTPSDSRRCWSGGNFPRAWGHMGRIGDMRAA